MPVMMYFGDESVPGNPSHRAVYMLSVRGRADCHVTEGCGDHLNVS